ncbi:hypothetical protein LLEC1_02099 [Akanthomyces lecanii]|uniref:Peptidase M20 dimerisation domain-containing protein n=1 Tax=Cordyceps confragosa TaxID=2714763 RepID=A0A179I974_CORDF|nr:hypothetical protein LLEC1_02099 [Akanthomyces lecanii]
MANGLDTSFEASSGSGGREVVLCAEYDALPAIDHACGHNLIIDFFATSLAAASLGASRAFSELQTPVRVRILGTPAEEVGGGKIAIIRAAAFSGASASIMSHPVTPNSLCTDTEVSGSAALNLVPSIIIRVDFRGRSAHAAAGPWNRLNALDSAVAATFALGGTGPAVFETGGTVPNVIEAGASATRCSAEYLRADDSRRVVGNQAICETFSTVTAMVDRKVLARQERPLVASTDMGNVSPGLPSMHGALAIPAIPGAALHGKQFARAIGGRAEHEAATDCGTEWRCSPSTYSPMIGWLR